MIVLDTNHLTVLKYHGSPKCERLLARLVAAAETAITTTIISVEEQMRGWLAAIHKRKDIEQQLACYRELEVLLKFLRTRQVLCRWTNRPQRSFRNCAGKEFGSERPI